MFKVGGTTRDSLNIGDIRQLTMPLPSLNEQMEIVKSVEEQLSRLDVSLTITNAMERKVESLRRSLLQASFCGNLTKEWREARNG